MEMECPHLIQYIHKFPTHFDPLICSACKSDENPWLCLDCGRVNCGRYIKGHAKAHYEEQKHSISVDCCSFAAYCYTCESYVTNHVINRRVFDVLNTRHGSNSSNFEYEDSDSENNDRNSDITSSSSSSLTSTTSNQDEDTISTTSSNISSNRNNANQNINIAAGRLNQIRPINGKRKKRRKTRFTTTKQKSGGNDSKRNSVVSVNRNSTGVGVGSNRKRKRDDSEGSNISNGDLSDSDFTSSGKKQKLLKEGDNRRNRRRTNNNNRNNDTAAAALEVASKNLNIKHGLVGLRNLGNSCFMGAAIQALSKIQAFSCYMCTIPSQDQLKINNNNNSPSFQLNGKFTFKRIPYSTRSRKNGLLSSSNNSLHGGGNGGNNNLTTINNNNNVSNSQLKASANCENGISHTTTNNNKLALVKSSEADIERELRAEEFLVDELRKILVSLSTKGSAPISPDTLFHVIWTVMPRFRGYQQQDAHEFLRYMLDRLHTELVLLLPKFSAKHKNGTTAGGNGFNGGEVGKFNSSRPFKNLSGYIGGKKDPFLSNNLFKGPSIVTSIFGGVLQNEVRCSHCGTESKKHDPFLDLSLDLPHFEESRLEDCLSRFIEVEELTDSDMYFCSNCKTKQKSTKRFWIRRLPKVLCLHLKRFRWSNCLRTKIDNYVNFPLTNLDMSRYCMSKVHETRGASLTGSALYDLSAVIVHHGSGVGSGHYTSMGKHGDDGLWYHFNDTSVKQIPESEVAKCKAYILFYKKTGLDSEVKN